MNSKKILLLGNSGFLGSGLNRWLSYQKLFAPSHVDLDLLDIHNVYNFIETNRPDIIIYAAGITKIDFAQVHSELTYALNYHVPEKIAKFVSKKNIQVIYISTDAVFDGYKNKYEFFEIDAPKPKSIYGISKLKGEQAILGNSSNNCVIRLITLYGIQGIKPNFVKSMLDNLKHGKTFQGIVDQIQNPLYVETAREAIACAINHNFKGIYHLGALDYDSNYNFLKRVALKFDLDSSLIEKVTFCNFMKNETEYRKKKSVLLCEKFIRTSQDKILKDIKSSIQQFYEASMKSTS